MKTDAERLGTIGTKDYKPRLGGYRKTRRADCVLENETGLKIKHPEGITGTDGFPKPRPSGIARGRTDNYFFKTSSYVSFKLLNAEAMAVISDPKATYVAPRLTYFFTDSADPQ